MLRKLFLLVPFLLLVHVTSAFALPLCNGKYHDPCFGVYLWPDGAKYVGEFKEYAKHGKGTTNWPDGAKYVGEYTNGKKHGQGTFTFPDGTKYAGEYKDGIQDGYGTMFWADGGVWVGQWKSDKWLSGKKGTEGEVPPDIMALFHKD